MATAWYTLIVGILITLNGIVFLIFDIEGFNMPDWYLGFMLIVGVVGIILGMVKVMKKQSTSGAVGKTPTEDIEEPKE